MTSRCGWRRCCGDTSTFLAFGMAPFWLMMTTAFSGWPAWSGGARRLPSRPKRSGFNPLSPSAGRCATRAPNLCIQSASLPLVLSCPGYYLQASPLCLIVHIAISR